ncbi:MAG: prolipoprotein diacylglyceryl transferase [Taibaiella sp.]|nr:prolipoprotein diacylglyceryl transferase [Taibaiella sp.]
MYPDFQYLLEALFGIPMPAWLGIFKTFGFFMALAFIAAARVTTLELKRKEKQGLMQPVLKNIKEKKKDPETGATTTTEKQVYMYPHQLITEIVFGAAIGGIIGAKIFNAFETWSDFIQDPIGSLFSRSGLTFYGGFIVATIVLYYYTRKYKIKFKHLCDATAPAIMLAYGLGRLGCQFSGDGDWGIYNTAYITQADGALRLSTPADAQYINSITANTQSSYYVAPAGMPRWLAGMNYPHNVGYEGMPIAGCEGEYCRVLPIAVFPTPVYEAVAAILLFGFMWSIRKKFRYPLQMFGLYLVLAGVERFLVELVRVNYKYDWGFVHPSQAEIISVVLFIAGTGLLLFYKPKGEKLPQ